jgi:hypothetical protein
LSGARRAVVAALSAIAMTGVGGIAFSSCVDTSGTTIIACPPFADFANVSPVLEKRCGTLDCHGMADRPMRIYGSTGLRAPDPDHANDPDYYPGGKTPTTMLELADNYRAVCGLEPEIMTEVTQGKAKPDALTFIRKPRLTEKHKGGRIWDQGKPGDRCLTGWLTPSAYMPGSFDPSDCIEELQHQ